MDRRVPSLDMRLPAFVLVAVVAIVGGSVATAGVATIERPAEADRTARRLPPAFRADLDPNERVALELVDLINLERSRLGLPNFQANDQVSAAAMAHAGDIAARQQLVHVGDDGSDAGTRLDRAGFVWRTWGETVGAEFGTPQPLLGAWLASPEHRPLLLGDTTYAGAGVVATVDNVPYWVLVVAS